MLSSIDLPQVQRVAGFTAMDSKRPIPVDLGYSDMGGAGARTFPSREAHSIELAIP
jgi:hypothetical protein